MMLGTVGNPALEVANLFWKYSITGGTYRTAGDGVRQTRIDCSIKALTDPLNEKVGPHGLLGQGFDSKYINGKVDDYVPDKNGLFTTSAQGEGAIEGAIQDYAIVPQSDPFSTTFKFSRFDKKFAPPRDTSKLNVK